MKVFLATMAVGMALSVPAFAQGGNIAGTESAGAPLNSSVNSSAIDPRTGLSPGAAASRGQVIVKRKHTRSGHYVYSTTRGRYVFVPN